MLPLILAAVFLLAACLYVFIATPEYEAKVTITSRAPQSNMLGQIASRVGLDIIPGLGRGSGLTDYDKLIDVLMSEDVAAELMTHDDLMRALFRNRWNAETHEWRPPTGTVNTIREGINHLFGLPGWTQPGAEPVVAMLESEVKMTRNDSGQSHTITFQAMDAATADAALKVLMKSSDRILRNRIRDTNILTVEFLHKQLSTEAAVDVRTELSRQLVQELQKSAMVSSDQPFSYEIVKNFSVSSRPVTPRPLLSMLIAVVAGLFVGAAITVLRASDWFKGPERSGLSAHPHGAN